MSAKYLTSVEAIDEHVQLLYRWLHDRRVNAMFNPLPCDAVARVDAWAARSIALLALGRQVSKPAFAWAGMDDPEYQRLFAVKEALRKKCGTPFDGLYCAFVSGEWFVHACRETDTERTIDLRVIFRTWDKKDDAYPLRVVLNLHTGKVARCVGEDWDKHYRDFPVDRAQFDRLWAIGMPVAP